MLPITIKTQVSSGGVAFRASADGIEVALISVIEMRTFEDEKKIVQKAMESITSV